MGAGHRHVSVGTVHVKAGHAVVFERTESIEDAKGEKHIVKNENRVIPWEDLKKVISKADVSTLESLGTSLLSAEELLEGLAKEEAAKKKKADEEAAKKTEEKK